MERRPFGSTGRDVAVIGQGTWQLRDDRRAAEALRAGLQEGMTHLDTAELYHGSEEVVRRAIAGFPRSELFIVSKVLPENASYRGTLAACEASLRRLGTPYLDGYLLHWWTGEHPIAETMRAMAELADAGKVRHIGVSNLGIEQLEEAQDVLGGKHRVVCDQVLYNLGRRGLENDLLPFCQDKDIAVVAYSPIGGPGGRLPTGRPRMVLDHVARKHGKTVRQVMLRWVTRLPGTFAIPKSEHPDHTRENAGGQGWQLDAEDLADLDEEFPVGKQGFLARFR